MFLSDGTIRKLIESGELEIDPFDPEMIQPCSIDLKLGHFAGDPIYIKRAGGLGGTWTNDLICPGQFALGSTLERIKLPNNIAATVSGKSTWGRKGVAVHITAGHIDPGWNGQITLEFFNHSDRDVEIKSGVAICQLLFTYLDLPAEKPYHGRYQNSVGTINPR